MQKIFNRLRKEESGQSLVMVVLLLSVLLSFSALIVDVGMLYAEKAKLQNAADAAALAGAQMLPDTGSAESTAVDYADSNGFPITLGDVEAPYDDDETKIKVKVSSTVPYIFANFLNLIGSGTSVSASAVAQNNQWSGEALPFVNMDDNYPIKGSYINAWEKVSSGGDKERINDTVVEVSSNDSIKVIIKDDYDGKGPYIYMKGGFAVGSKIPTPLTNIVVKDKTVYLLSLRSDLVTSKYYETISNINGFHIPMTNLVLLKCIVDENWNKSEKTVHLKFEESYNWDATKKTFTTVTGGNPGGSPKLIE